MKPNDNVEPSCPLKTPSSKRVSCVIKPTLNQILHVVLSSDLRKATSVSGPEQVLEFGPCGRLMRNPFSLITIQDPATQRLTWFKPPMTVLVIKKILDENVIEPFITLTTWLIEEKGMIVFVEKSVMEEPVLENQQNFSHIKNSLKTFHDQKDDLTDKIDIIICLGGDGTLLYASMLFQNQVPPIMAFHLGSLGFLTPFHFEGYKDSVTKVLQGDDVALTLRSRLRCLIYRGSGKENITTSQLVLNDVVIDRGSSPYISNINIFFENKYITTVQGDGLIISTSTGSTAYAVAAGASMMHPSVSAIMVTPICPHSLSFRPIIVPAGVELKVALAPESRNNAWVSFDGQKREELLHGDSLIVTTSIYPVPSISAQDQISDWFDSLSSCLHWNMRKKQKHFDSTSLSQTSISTDTEKDHDYIHLETPDS